jgi:hypothetical protein
MQLNDEWHSQKKVETYQIDRLASLHPPEPPSENEQRPCSKDQLIQPRVAVGNELQKHERREQPQNQLRQEDPEFEALLRVDTIRRLLLRPRRADDARFRGRQGPRRRANPAAW